MSRPFFCQIIDIFDVKNWKNHQQKFGKKWRKALFKTNLLNSFLHSTTADTRITGFDFREYYVPFSPLLTRVVSKVMIIFQKMSANILLLSFIFIFLFFKLGLFSRSAHWWPFRYWPCSFWKSVSSVRSSKTSIVHHTKNWTCGWNPISR